MVSNVRCVQFTLGTMYIVYNVHCVQCTLSTMFIVQNAYSVVPVAVPVCCTDSVTRAATPWHHVAWEHLFHPAPSHHAPFSYGKWSSFFVPLFVTFSTFLWECITHDGKQFYFDSLWRWGQNHWKQTLEQMLLTSWLIIWTHLIQ